MNKKILIVGGGYIGRRLAKALDAPLTARRVVTYNDVEALIKKYKPQVLINGIGHTGKRNVDDCEAVVEKTLHANTYVPILMAEAALRHGIKLVHISSGCIYHFNYKKQQPIQEERAPDYYDLFYSRTKIYAEDMLMRLANGKHVNVLIARIRVPLDNTPHPKNLLTKLIKYRKVIDAPNSVTYIPDFIKALQHLIARDAKGIFNIMLKDGLNYPDLMDIYAKKVPGFKYDTIDLKKLNLNRTSLLMSVHKLEKTGFKVRRVKDVLNECVDGYVNSK